MSTTLAVLKNIIIITGRRHSINKGYAPAQTHINLLMYSSSELWMGGALLVRELPRCKQVKVNTEIKSSA